MASMRLHKALAQAGVTSRRKAEELIKEGRITVGGKVATIGQSVDQQAVIKIDGKRVELEPFETQVLMLNKPEGTVCSHHDPYHTNSIFDLLPKPPGGKWISIGRLDIATSGLLLITNNGKIANFLMHPSNKHKRVYRVRVRGEIDEAILKKLTQKIVLEDGPAAFHHVTHVPEQSDGKNQWFQVSLYEGRNRIVRRLWEAVGCQVSRLIRLQMGDFVLPRTLKAGEHQPITEKQLKAIYSAMSDKRA